jgi:hypothetical protein
VLIYITHIHDAAAREAFVMWGQRVLNSGDEVWDATVNGSANRRVEEEVTLRRTVP